MRGKGFNLLLEIVVAVALSAVLAGVLVPQLVKYTEEARIARARSECAILGAAITSFHSDLGRWPTADGASAKLPDALHFAEGAAGVPAAMAAGVPSWLDGPRDSLNNHLAFNDPGEAAHDYPCASQHGEGVWRGPYVFEVPADPWGRRYYVNLGALWSTEAAWAGSTDNLPRLAAYVLSAGPNGRIETFPRQDGSLTRAGPVADRMYAVGGDDVAFRIK